MRRQNVNDLLVFLAVARERSFTKVAAKLEGFPPWCFVSEGASPRRLNSHTLAALTQGFYADRYRLCKGVAGGCGVDGQRDAPGRSRGRTHGAHERR
jgi:hypothetical protein